MSAAQDLQDLQRAQLDSQWLLRQGDLVLGPLSGHQLVEKLYSGELTGETQVSASGPNDFRKLKELDAFRLHVARAAAKQRVEAEVRAVNARHLRQRLLVAGVVAGVFGALGLGAWQIMRYSAIYLPGVESGELDIQVSPPTITLARPSVPEELLAYPGEPKRTPEPPATSTPPDSRPPGASPDKPEKPPAVASASPLPKPEKPERRRRPTGRVSTDPDGMSTEVNYDQAAINRVVKQHQSSLFRCLKEEAERRPGFSAKVPIEFTIGNDGRVAQLWVDHPQLKKGPLFECFFTELRKWPFKPYRGERATVGLSFTVGKKG
jgi:hypothetical protein